LAKTPPLTGASREQVIGFMHKPLTAWLRTMMAKMFDKPRSSEACDITATAVSRALQETIGAEPSGKAVLEHLALDILENLKK
jgi:hypothetical protein